MALQTTEEGKVKATEPRLIRVGIWRAWSIKWPYRSDRYIYFGAKKDAESTAKKLTGKWSYKPSIRELKL
jgi:hypothetical protein